MLRIFRFYLGNDSVVIFKDDGSMENSHNSVDVVRGDRHFQSSLN